MSMLGGLPTFADFTRAGGVLTTSLVIAMVFSWFLVKRLPASRRLTNLGIFLGQETSAEIGYTSADPRSDLVGVEGVAITDLRPAGTGQFGEERIDVVTESEWIEHGSRIRIVASEGVSTHSASDFGARRGNSGGRDRGEGGGVATKLWTGDRREWLKNSFLG